MIERRPVLTIVRSLAAASLLGSVGLIGYSGIAAAHGPTMVEAAVATPSHCCDHHGDSHHDHDNHHDHDHHCCDHGGGGGDEDNGGGDEGGDSGGMSAPATPMPGMGSKGTTSSSTTMSMSMKGMSMKGMAAPMTTSGSNGDLPFEGGLLLGGAGLGLLGAARRLREGR